MRKLGAEELEYFWLADFLGSLGLLNWIVPFGVPGPLEPLDSRRSFSDAIECIGECKEGLATGLTLVFGGCGNAGILIVRRRSFPGGLASRRAAEDSARRVGTLDVDLAWNVLGVTGNLVYLHGLRIASFEGICDTGGNRISEGMGRLFRVFVIGSAGRAAVGGSNDERELVVAIIQATSGVLHPPPI